MMHVEQVILKEFESRVFVDGGKKLHPSPCSLLREILGEIAVYRRVNAPCPVCGEDMEIVKDCNSYFFECSSGCCVSTDSCDSPLQAFDKMMGMDCFKSDWHDTVKSCFVNWKPINPPQSEKG